MPVQRLAASWRDEGRGDPVREQAPLQRLVRFPVAAAAAAVALLIAAESVQALTFRRSRIGITEML